MKLDEYLKTENLSSAEFGAKIGVSGRSVDYYRNLERQPRRQVTKEIIRVTDGKVTANDLCA
jgi:hypothetical protein